MKKSSLFLSMILVLFLSINAFSDISSSKQTLIPTYDIEITPYSFGRSVSISGNFTVVGSPYSYVGSSYEDRDDAAAHIFENIAGFWIEKAKLTVTNDDIEEGRDGFGYSVSISGNCAIIGAPFDDSINTEAGSAYIFEYSSGTWVQVAKLISSDATNDNTYGRFGQTVSISGNYAIIGARNNNWYSETYGNAYIFEKINGIWMQVAKLAASDAANWDYFGEAVSISGNYAIVGAPGKSDANDPLNKHQGAVYIFERINGTWIQVEKLTGNTADSIENFGRAVSISNDQIIIGAPPGQESSYVGSAYVFELIFGTWTQVAKLVDIDGQIQDGYGSAVSISGDFAIVGAPSDIAEGSNDEGNKYIGSVFIYKYNGSTWDQIEKLISDVADDNQNFGQAAAISNDYAIVGEPNEFDAGHAYSYSLSSSPTNSPPYQPTGLNELEVTLNNLTLAWNDTGDPDNDPVKYCVIIKEAGVDKALYSGCDDEFFGHYIIRLDGICQFTLPVPLRSGTTYWWAVWAIDSNNNWSEASDWSSFTAPGIATGLDSDNDGIPDDWEERGVCYDDITGEPRSCWPDEEAVLKLNEMGSDPNTPDLFVEIDYLVDNLGDFENSYGPTNNGLELVIQAFKKQGINIHIDSGPNSIMNPITGEPWGKSFSKSTKFYKNFNFEIDPILIVGPTVYTGSLVYADCNVPDREQNNNNLLTEFWAEFNNKIKTVGFFPQRKGIFHYCFFGNRLGGGLGGTSGISRGIPGSDLVVTLPTDVSDGLKATTFMHELGHNLGLGHGGPVKIAERNQANINFKPNYLSIMNYSFQETSGLLTTTGATLDYSPFILEELNESNLPEFIVLNIPHLWNNTYKTIYYCDGNKEETSDTQPNIINLNGCDWNINYNPKYPSCSIEEPQILKSYKDWANLIFTGGEMGCFGTDCFAGIGADLSTLEEITIEQLDEVQLEHSVVISGPSKVLVCSGIPSSLNFVVKNTGQTAETIAVAVTSDFGWIGLDQNPMEIFLNPGLETEIAVLINVPEGMLPGKIENVTLTATLRDFNSIIDTAELTVESIDCTPPEITLTVSPDTLWPPNHKMVNVTPTIITTDNCDLEPEITLTITMDEGEETNTFDPDYDTTLGDGNTLDDIQVDAEGNIFLRAERSGQSDGRVYTLIYKATDQSGNSATAKATVTVPHDMN